MNVSRRVLKSVILGLILAAGVARGDYYMVHGNAAEAEYPPAWSQIAHVANGLQGYMLPNQVTRIQVPLAVMMPVDYRLFKVKALVYAGSDLHVTKFELWDGGTPVKAVTNSWTGNVTISMKPADPYRVLHGLNLCLTLVSGSSANVDDRRFVINSAGALLYPLIGEPVP